MTRPPFRRSDRTRAALLGAATLGLALACGGVAVTAQQPALTGSARILDGLRGCRAVASAPERAACYDGSVDALLGAVEAGEVRLVDREEVRRTRRQLFGISIPDVPMLQGDDKDENETSDLLETTIASGGKTGPSTWRLTTAEGAVWEINNPPRKIAPIMPGDKVVFKKASLGYYFIRINGQLGVKGRRIS